MEPDERACGEVLLTMQPETEFLISVGSGSITDTTRVVAVRTGKPFVCIGTAPSMDGYTSVVAPLILRGVKIHRAANCPEIIVCDLDILRTSPMPMVVSGIGDVLALTIMLEVGDIRRFATVGDFASYARCVGSRSMRCLGLSGNAEHRDHGGGRPIRAHPLRVGDQ